MVDARDLHVAYVAGRDALRGVSLKVGAGEICMILGPSGSGKSTFLKALKGLLRPTQGTISLFGRQAARPLRRRARLEPGVAYIPQHLGLVRNLTVLDNTLIGVLGATGTLRSLLKMFPAPEVSRATTTLESLGVGHKLHEKVYALSGGERQRVAIARALMQQPRLVLADEFVSQLDPVTTREVMDAVRAIAAAGVTFVITSHEIDLVCEYADRAVFFRDGRKIRESDRGGLHDPAAVVRMMAG
jgi:phosphonate transport system ATP-binding protein